ncbi:MAG: prepilin-type N-terminal cleavage/methylation domain-containing protein [Pseudomonadales bacterium]
MNQRGFTLVELLVSMALAAILLASLASTVFIIGQSQDQQTNTAALAREADFALRRMSMATSASNRLLLPLHDRLDSVYTEHSREQFVPAAAPSPGTTFDTAVLAVALGAHSDLDFDGVPDADNDGDGLIDEDWPADQTNDGATGLVNLDDDGDGLVDEAVFFATTDDDEESILDVEAVNGLDDDNDGSVDDDTDDDMNRDGEAGIAGLDDDGDGSIDEGSRNDDDEDGSVDEDWLDAHAFYLSGSDLVERLPVPWDANGDSAQDGLDYLESIVATGVTYFSVQLLTSAYAPAQLLEVGLILEDSDGFQVKRTLRLRVQKESS